MTSRKQLRIVLEERHIKPPDEPFDETPFSEDAHYAQSSADDALLTDEWTAFENELLTSARFFSPMVRSMLIGFLTISKTRMGNRGRLGCRRGRTRNAAECALRERVSVGRAHSHIPVSPSTTERPRFPFLFLISSKTRSASTEPLGLKKRADVRSSFSKAVHSSVSTRRRAALCVWASSLKGVSSNGSSGGLMCLCLLRRSDCFRDVIVYMCRFSYCLT